MQQSNLQNRLANFMEEKNSFRQIAGSALIGVDMNETLLRLQNSLNIKVENLIEVVEKSVLKYGVLGNDLSMLWAQKVAEGADTVAIVDGVFGFFKNNQKLVDPTRELKVPVKPAIYEFRDKEKFSVLATIKLQLEELKAEIIK